jgi:hypothetical protein
VWFVNVAVDLITRRVHRLLLRQDFDRDDTFEPHILCTVHLAHPARAQTVKVLRKVLVLYRE